MDKKLIVERIDELMLQKGISNFKLMANTDISTTVYQWRKNTKREEKYIPSLKSIEKICKFLDVSLSEFFAFTDEEERNTRVIELSNSLSGLTNEQLKVIKSIVEEFKKK